MFPYLRNLLLYPEKWIKDHFLFGQLLAFLSKEFINLNKDQVCTLLFLMTHPHNLSLLNAFFENKNEELIAQYLNFLSEPFSPTQYSETHCPILQEPIIRENAVLYCAAAENGKGEIENFYGYVSDVNDAISKLEICPLSRGEIQWWVRLADLDDETFLELREEDQAEKLKIKISEEWIKKAKVNLGNFSNYPTGRINVLVIEKSGDTGIANLCATSRGRQFLIRHPEILTRITAETWNRPIAWGPDAGTYAFYWLCCSLEGRRFLRQHPEVLIHITTETWNRPRASGLDAGACAFYWLCCSLEGRRFLDQHSEISTQITAETWNRPRVSGPDAGACAFYWLCCSLEGRRFLRQHPEISTQITAETWNRPMASGRNAGTCAFHRLCVTLDGCQFLLQHPEILTHITVETWKFFLVEKKVQLNLEFLGLLLSTQQGCQVIVDFWESHFSSYSKSEWENLCGRFSIFDPRVSERIGFQGPHFALDQEDILKVETLQESSKRERDRNASIQNSNNVSSDSFFKRTRKNPSDEDLSGSDSNKPGGLNNH